MQTDEVLLQEIIELRACLHRVGLNASDRDIISLLTNTRKTRGYGLAEFSAKRPDRG